ncbi:MAG: oligosaccharide flippase family protein [Bacillota bacterium]
MKLAELALAAYRPHRNLLDDAAITLAVNLLGTLLLFLTQVFLARLMGVTEFSLYSFSFTILTIASTLSVFGFDVAVLRFIPAALAHEDWRTLRGFTVRAIQVTILTSTLAGLLVAAAAWLLGGRWTSGLAPTLMATAFGIPFACLLLLYSAFARGLKRPLLAAAPRLLLKPVAFVGFAALLWLFAPPLRADRAVLAELGANLLAVAFLAAVIAAQLRPLWRRFEPSFDTRKWVGVSFPLFLTTGFQLLTRQTDILLLGTIMGAHTVGPYAAASRISQLAAFGLLSINAVLPALVSRHLAKGELDAARKIVSVASFAIFIFSAAAAAIIWLFANFFLGAFGTGFADAVPVLHILIVGQVLNAVTGSVSYILGVTGHQKVLALVVLSTMFVNALLCALTIPLFGQIGAAVAVTVSTSASNLFLVYVCTKRAAIDPSIYGAVKRLLTRQAAH